MERASLLDRTSELLKNCELPLPEIASGAGIGYEWLKKFKAGAIPDPSVNRIQLLHDYLHARLGRGEKTAQRRSEARA